MHIEILQENLLRSLSVASRLSGSKVQMPILGNILLLAQKNEIVIESTNLDMSLRITTAGKIIEEGSCTVPARTFLEMVNLLPLGKVILKQSEGQLLVSSKDTSAKIAIIPASEWPEIKFDHKKEKHLEISVEVGVWQAVIGKTLFSVAGDDTRPVLTGVLLEAGKEKLKIVATDGYRMAVKTIPVKISGDEDFSNQIIIPAKAVAEISRIISEKKDLSEFSLVITGSQVTYHDDQISFQARLIAGNYPAYEKIIPRDFLFSIESQAEDLAKAVKMAGIFARDSANIVKISFKEEVAKLTVSAVSAQIGENVSNVEITGKEVPKKDLTIGFNYHYLTDFFSVAGSDSVVISITGELTSCVFRSVSDKDYFYLVMPVKLGTE